MTDYVDSDSEMALRFRRDLDWFVAGKRAGAFVACIGANAERAVDLLHVLTTHLDPAVDVRIHDARGHADYEGYDLPLPDVREALGRLRLPLASFGGVEVTVFTPNDQVTLTPELLLIIYARTERWFFLLEGLGLRERAELPAPHWHPLRLRMAPVSEVSAALEAAVSQLGLSRVAA